MIIIAFILGVFIGCSVSLFIVAGKVAKSNDLGNTKGRFTDFSGSTIRLIVKQDRIKRPKF